MILWSHMIISLIFKVKILVFIKCSHRLPPIMLSIKPNAITKSWACGPIFFKHMLPFWYPLLKPCLTTPKCIPLKYRCPTQWTGRNRLLVTDELVEFEKHPVWSSRLHKNYRSRQRNLSIMPWLNGENERSDQLDQCLGSSWAYIVGQDPSDSKSSRFHVDIFRFCFHSFEAYSIDSSKMIGNSHEFSNFNWLFLKLNWFICN